MADLQTTPAGTPRPKRQPAVYRPMTADEQRLARALGRCSFPVASFDKRFARDISARTTLPEPTITEKQAALLRAKVTRYRRQIRASDLPESERNLLAVPKKKSPEAVQAQLARDRENAPRGFTQAELAAREERIHGDES